MSEASWLTAQVTIGNIVVVLSMVANIGYQMRRLLGIETDLQALRAQQDRAVKQRHDDKVELEARLDAAARSIESTYSRKDVQAETMERISASLSALVTQQGEIRAELRELRRQRTEP
jgi:hypothetical protein